MRKSAVLIILALLLLCACDTGKSTEFPLYKNVARQENEDGWVYTFVYEYEKENVEPIDGLISFCFYGINVRYRYAEKYAEAYPAPDREGVAEAREHQPGVLIFGESAETAADAAKTDALLMNSSKEELLALNEGDLEFSTLDKSMFFRLMQEALIGEPQPEGKGKAYWDLPSYAALAEKEYLDGYKFQVCFLQETGLVDVCYIDVLYQTGAGLTDYVQLSDLVENGSASEEQTECFRELQDLTEKIEEEESFMAGSEGLKNRHFGEIEMKRLDTFLTNIHNGDYAQYIAAPVS